VNENDISQGGALETRSIRVRAFGDTADEIDFFALDEARAVFGPDAVLVVQRNYIINRVDMAWIPQAGGKKYTASVDVRELAGPPS
jgi:hypothetical protein